MTLPLFPDETLLAPMRTRPTLISEPLPRVVASTPHVSVLPAEAIGGPEVRLFVPDVATKQLKLQRNEQTKERWLRISSNLLALYGFAADTRIERVVRDESDGLEFRVDPAGATKVYTRRYPRRRNNPTEVQLDVKSQTVIDAAFPRYVERVHVTMEAGKVVCRPIMEGPAIIRARHRSARNPLTAFAALSAGVDAACLAQVGFSIRSLLDWRPPEKRDTTAGGFRDMTETGILGGLSNLAIPYVFNEDLRQVQYARLREIRANEETLGMLHMAIQCDDFSVAKGSKLKAMHLDDGDTVRDLTYYGLRLVEETRPVTVVVENVPGYSKSPEADQLRIVLRRMGYAVQDAIFDARDFGGWTSRKRFYLVATQLPGYVFPVPGMPARTPGALWETVVADQLAYCRDVTDNVSVQKGIEGGRIRLITPETSSAPTVLKSQNRMTKDAIYLQLPNGRILFPTETILQRLNGIPDQHRFTAVSGEVATEQIGQSIDWPMHHAIASSVRAHLLEHWEGAPLA
jgi:DNA (cytosine-5)-methyltransferase 1